MSSISTIPLETLLHIFLFLQHSVDRKLVEAQNNPVGPPRLVCRFWNIAVTETGRFWTTIRVNLAASLRDEGWRAIFSLHLQRTRDLPLDIVLLGRKSNSSIVKALKKLAIRWRSVTVPHWNGVDPADLDLNLEMPNLVALHVMSAKRIRNNIIVNAPKLQSLEWGHGGISFPPCHTPPIRTMSLQAPTNYSVGGSIALEDLSRFQETLQEFSFKSSNDPATFEHIQLEHWQQVTFQSLHTLRFHGRTDDSWLPLLGNCHFPNLQTLAIRVAPRRRPDIPFTTLPIWHSVRRLEWTGYETGMMGRKSDNLKIFLSACPNISAISFGGSPRGGHNPELIILLTTRMGNIGKEVVYCRGLEEIEGDCASLDIVEELTRRRPALRKVTVKRWYPEGKVGRTKRPGIVKRIKLQVHLVVLSTLDSAAREHGVRS